MRLLAGLIAGLPIGATLDGDDSLRGRPMERLAEPLRAMGARVETTDGHAPISVWGTRVPAALEHRLPVASAQLLGAICLAALSAGGETRVLVPGPTRDHTERLLAWMGVPIERHAIDGDLRGDRSPGRSPGLSGRSSGATVTAIRGPVRPGARSLTVPGDPSAATPWLVAAALHPDAELRLVGVGLNPTRLAALELLREMGADIEILPWPDAVYSVGDSAGRGSVAGGGPVAETAPVHAVGDSPGHGSGAGAGPSAERAPVHAVGDSPGHGSGAGAGPSAERAPVHAVADSPGPEPIGDVVVRSSGRLRAVRIGGERVAELIDELPVLAVAMAAAEGTSELRDAGELRVKESDRIAAVVEGLGAIGARVEELPDGWRVRGGVPRGWAGGGVPRDAAIATRGDHRIAIAFAVAALAGLAASVRLDDPACVAVSYPTFWDDVAHATGSTPRPATSAAAVGAAGR
jgi:3-phosphoshikimate 1-carboxyvinyltransferase